MSNRGNILFPSLAEKAKNKHIPIYTLGYGAEEELNQKELMYLSAISGAGIKDVGSFIRIDQEHWQAKFQQIKRNIANLYYITWNPTVKIPGTPVHVKLTVMVKHGNETHKKEMELFYVYEEKHKIQATPQR